MAIVLIGGGVRSGKSTYAVSRARESGGTLGFIATAQALDHEMTARIARHKELRGGGFTTIEEPLNLAGAIRALKADAIIVDCLTLWLSNMVHAAGVNVNHQVDAALQALCETTARVFIVTNEIGWGVVPVTALGRAFRDQSGEVNQRFARAADEVYLMVFGQPLRLK